MAKNKPLKKWTSEELKAGYYRNRPQEDSEGGFPQESDSLGAIRNEKFGRLSKDTQSVINRNADRAFFRANLLTQAELMRGDDKATLGRTLGRMQAKQDSTMFEKPDGYAYGGRVKGKEAKPMKKMAEAKMEKSKKDMASDKKMTKGYAFGGVSMDPLTLTHIWNRVMDPENQVRIRNERESLANTRGKKQDADTTSAVRKNEMSAKKQGMDPKSAARMDEMKWVKGVQKKAGYAFGGMVKGGKGKKGC